MCPHDIIDYVGDVEVGGRQAGEKRCAGSDCEER